jgi:oligopeptide transport system permease protein
MFANVFKRSMLARTSLVLLLLVGVAALIGPSASGWQFDEIDWDSLETAPSAVHWFGTDLIGRDLFVRTMLGARVSLLVALIATSVSLCIGVPYGLIAGFRGGRTDQIMMRIVDGMYALPFILLVILLVVLFGRNQYLLFAALGAVFWLDIARIVRGQTLRIKHAPFVEAAKSLGAPTKHILLHHVLPNVLGPVVVYTTLTIPGVILAESFISFLGLGIQEPETSWGVLVSDGTQSMESSPWMLLFPAGCLAITIWCFNTLGDRLRDQLDRRDNARITT